MSENTKIEWCDHTFNPWEGCQKVGPGCDNCYAEARNARFAGGTAINWGPGAPRRRTSASNWNKPRAWNGQQFFECTCCGWRGSMRDKEFHTPRKGCIHDLVPARARVFCASLADVFDNAVDPQWRADLFALIEATPNLDWLLLTKRIGNVRGMLAELAHGSDPDLSLLDMMPLSNVWLGATIVNQAEADRDIPKLLEVPAAKRFLSMEPLLGPVDLMHIPVSGAGHHEFDPIITANVLKRAEAYPPLPQVDWVIVGGESGPGARPIHPDWARSLRDQCDAAGVPFLFKQWGEWAPRDQWSFHVRMCKQCAIKLDGSTVSNDDAPQDVGGQRFELVGKKAAGRNLDGRTWDGVPS